MGSQYCQPSDLSTYAINANALVNITTPELVAACVAASEKADSYMRGRYALPLVSWGTDVTMHTAWMATFFVMSARGINPSAGADVWIKDRYDEAVAWFEGIERQRVHPDVTPQVAQPGDPIHDLPQVFTDPQRGWGSSPNGGTPRV